MVRRALAACAVFFGVCLFLLAAMLYYGAVQPNRAAARAYPVQGVDVSSYQGEIDWDTLAQGNISFAYIKATEGSSFVDSRFADNWAAASQTGLQIGAYHFFSYDSSGKTQAEHMIRTVPKQEGMLPPAIDVEFYGDKEQNPPPREEVSAELGEMIRLLEEHYGVTPVLYATEKSYRLYLAGDYPDCPIWIRDIWERPELPDQRQWTLWQYSSREQMEGYHGKERYIDRNVFYGTEAEWEQSLSRVL